MFSVSLENLNFLEILEFIITQEKNNSHNDISL